MNAKEAAKKAIDLHTALRELYTDSLIAGSSEQVKQCREEDVLFREIYVALIRKRFDLERAAR